MNNFIVITTINHPTKAVIDFSKLKNHQLIIVADQKTPIDWYLDNVHILSVGEQKKLDFQLVSLLPDNHYSRKNIGYLYAIRSGADLIIDTDDDNLPKEDWIVPKFQGLYNISSPNLGFVNIYKFFTDSHIWPRGFPLDKVTMDSSILKSSQITQRQVNIGVWQGLADGDPDVDAIYRLTLNKPCYFSEREPIALDKGTICPFNSQNTAFYKDLFPLLYLPSFVTFRYTDILRGLIAQPILWQAGYCLGFTHATVFQERNFHDYMKDFESEIPCYLHPYKVIDTVCPSISSSFSISDNLHNAYSALCKEGIVNSNEVKLLDLWLKDLDHHE